MDPIFTAETRRRGEGLAFQSPNGPNRAVDNQAFESQSSSASPRLRGEKRGSACSISHFSLPAGVPQNWNRTVVKAESSVLLV